MRLMTNPPPGARRWSRQCQTVVSRLRARTFVNSHEQGSPLTRAAARAAESIMPAMKSEEAEHLAEDIVTLLQVQGVEDVELHRTPVCSEEHSP